MPLLCLFMFDIDEYYNEDSDRKKRTEDHLPMSVEMNSTGGVELMHTNLDIIPNLANKKRSTTLILGAFSWQESDKSRMQKYAKALRT